MWKRCVVTGGVGSGKTSLVHFLRETPNLCVKDEEATIIIKQQLEDGGDMLPWLNPIGFAELVTKNSVITFYNSPIESCNCIFDRGIPDSLAFLRMDGINPNQELIMLAKTHIYDIAFWAPPWQEIFENRPERPQSWAYSKKLGLLLKDIYISLGYNIIELPKVTILERAEFVKKHLKKCINE